VAATVVLGGSVVDLAIGVGLSLRRWARPAALAAVCMSLLYLLGGTVLVPGLWADPMGPLLKIVPEIGLALAVAALLEDR
jgi:hypothetical protein